MLRFLFSFLKKEVKTPLGRWHNCGSNYDEKHFFVKQKLKESREMMKLKHIDPHKRFAQK
jgi:hypothetical protein